MLKRTEQLIQQRVRALLEQAGASIEDGRFADAGRLLDEAGQLAPEHAQLAVQRSRLASAQAAQERESADKLAARARASRPPDPALAGAAIPAVRPSLTAKERAEIEDLYRRGQAAAEAGKSDDALRYWELVWSAQPGYQGVDDYLKREYLMRGMEQFTAGRLEEATRYWEKALQVDPGDERTLGYLARAREQLMRSREILSE
jgi:tetratricopeptide (TPR) repeat protein